TRTSPIRPLRALGAYLTGYALLRFVVEIFRGDAGRGFLARVELPALAETLGLPPDTPLFLSVSQGVSLLVLAGVAVAVLWPRPRSPAGHPGAPSLQ
ncbi:MAG: hypothetical protein FJ098_03140, partial [Deltaproteobacteria bacterium]|nr:hypothetical protein [Deltaproteobacteria bacterium]